MPDVHWGMGATVGSVIPTLGAIIPAAVGVDIGCGMMAVRTSIRAEHLPDNLFGIRSDIEAAVPHGRTDNGGRNDKGAWQVEPPAIAAEKWAGLKEGYDDIVARTRRRATRAASVTWARWAPATTSSSCASTRRATSG
jgi:tRNA-splicing ligase RtcB